MTESKILNYWPMKGSTPRMSQEKVLQYIEGLPSHIKYILAEIPVGGGKSPVGINLSAYLADGIGDSFILTPQKILQKQYQDSFTPEQLFSLYGKSNYKCEPKNTNCEIGSDIKPRCESCPHKTALARAKNSHNLVLNYTLGLILFSNPVLKFTKRKLLVMDECHTLEHHLTEFKALQIGERRCRQFKVDWKYPKDDASALSWLKDKYYPAVLEEVARMQPIIRDIESRYEAGESVDKADNDLIRKFKDDVDHLDLLTVYTSMTLEHIQKNYALIKEKSFFKFKELYGRNIFEHYIKPMADKFLFMSSTILDKDAYCSDLGIPPEETAFISVESEFDQDNRQVIYYPAAKMNYGWDSAERKKDRVDMLEAVQQILTLHKDDNGIIHTGSFQVAKWLTEELKDRIPHRIMHHNPEGEFTRDEVIDEFIKLDPKMENAVLISPSITEGLDLKDDKGRFSIIVKIPFPYLGDAWIKRRMELSGEWYRRQAMIGVIQASGRVTRSMTDWGHTYILDQSFDGLYNSMRAKIPKWWKDSVQK